MAPSGDHSMATTASSTRRGVHELTPDLLFRFFSTERDWRVPSHRASSGHGTRHRAQGQGEGQGEGEDGPASTMPVTAAPAAAPPFMIEFSQACVSVPLPGGAAAAAWLNRVASVGP